ncbi:GEVED domain-containing protein [Vaginella massiliensis]|uniref:GEVED domain-containing protein n=1 Tax=Vaginella massiliensis TaxID=1816680 RepID=UPI0037505F5D
MKKNYLITAVLLGLSYSSAQTTTAQNENSTLSEKTKARFSEVQSKPVTASFPAVYCTYSQTTSPDLFIKNFSTQGGTTNINNLNSGYAPGGYQDVTSQAISLYADGTFSFKMDFTDNFGSNIWIDWNNDQVFSDDEKVFASGTYFPSIAGTIRIPAGTPNGNYRMRVVGDWLFEDPAPCGVNQYGGEAEDYTVTVIDPPNCMPPVDIKLNKIFTDRAEISWTDKNGSTTWSVLYGPSGFNPETEGNVETSTSASSFVIDNLEANTAYDVYVKANCGDGASEYPFVPLTFYTTCDAVALPYLQDFESATLPDIPSCTRLEKVGYGKDWEIASITEFGFNGKVLQYKFSSRPANAWFYTQGIQLQKNATYELSYRYGTNMTGYTEKMNVAIGKNPAVTYMTQDLADHPMIKNVSAETNTVNFTVEEDGTYFIGFHVYSDKFQDLLFLDDILVKTKTLNVTDEKISDLKYYPNPVSSHLGLTSEKIMESVTIYNLTGQKVLTAMPKASKTLLNLSSLPAGNYVVEVKFKDDVKTMKILKK